MSPLLSGGAAPNIVNPCDGVGNVELDELHPIATQVENIQRCVRDCIQSCPTACVIIFRHGPVMQIQIYIYV